MQAADVSTPDKVLDRALHCAALLLASEPRVRQHLRHYYMKKAVITTGQPPPPPGGASLDRLPLGTAESANTLWTLALL